MRHALSILILALLPWGQSAAAADLGSYKIADWRVQAYSNEHTGAFSNCAMDATYKSGISLVFAQGKDFGWTMWLFNPAWHLDDGSLYTLAYSIDNGATRQASAMAADPHGVIIPLPDDQDIPAQLSSGSILRIDAAGGHFSFVLDGTSQALAAVTSCVKKRAGVSNGAETSQSVSRSQAVPGTSSQRNKAEAIVLMSNLLQASGIAGSSMVDPQLAAKATPGSDATWSAPEVFGDLTIVPTAEPDDIDSYFSGASTVRAKICSGKFASSTPPIDAEEKGIVLGHLLMACDAGPKSSLSFYTLVARPRGGMYLLAVEGVVGPSGGTAIQSAEDKMMSAVVRMRGRLPKPE